MQKQERTEAPQTVTGIIFVTRKAAGYLPHADFTQDIEIPEGKLNTALHGDTVTVRLLPNKNGERQRGVVASVDERARTSFVGTIDTHGETTYLQPDNKRAYTKFRITNADKHPLQKNTKVVAEMDSWTNPDQEPTATITDVLGTAGEHETEMRAVVVEHGFDAEFPPNVEAEAQEIKRNPPINDHDHEVRRDMRDIATATIDPKTAKDFDDALSIRETEDGNYEIGIHIADVSRYVTPGSAIDTEARHRGTSVYLVDRTIPMLPEVLSNDICSLNPNEEKLAFSAVFTITPDAHVIDRWFGETIIRSDRRFTYKDAQDIIDAGGGELFDELNALNTIAKQFRTKRIKDGAIAFEQDEVVFELADDGTPIDVHVKPVLDTNKLVEEYMLLANREAAFRVHELAKKDPSRSAAFIYRVHDTPNPEKIEDLATFVRAIGYDFETRKGTVSAAAINELFKKIEDSPEEQLIKTATIRSMAKAVYSTKNIGHFGLSFEYYTHFTSPIRRYPDLMVHRIFKKHLAGEPISQNAFAQYEKIALAASEREAEAVAAERESIKFKQVEYMSTKVGETFDARVTGVTDFGIFIEEKTSKADGLIRLGSIKSDYYVLDEKNYRLVGEKSGNTYKLGDEIKVKLTGADIENRQLDFVFAR